MKFTLLKASNDKFKREIEINSLEDLKALQEYYRHPRTEEETRDSIYCSFLMEQPSLIVDFNKMEIYIYDNYME